MPSPQMMGSTTVPPFRYLHSAMKQHVAGVNDSPVGALDQAFHVREDSCDFESQSSMLEYSHQACMSQQGGRGAGYSILVILSVMHEFKCHVAADFKISP